MSEAKHYGATVEPSELDWEWNTRDIIAEIRTKESPTPPPMPVPCIT